MFLFWKLLEVSMLCQSQFLEKSYSSSAFLSLINTAYFALVSRCLSLRLADFENVDSVHQHKKICPYLTTKLYDLAEYVCLTALIITQRKMVGRPTICLVRPLFGCCRGRLTCDPILGEEAMYLWRSWIIMVLSSTKKKSSQSTMHGREHQ